MKVFLSCVSTEFKSYRLRLANQLGALKGEPYEIKVQEDFQQGGYTLLDKLADYVRECDLVIHLVGDACGARPAEEHVARCLLTLAFLRPNRCRRARTRNGSTSLPFALAGECSATWLRRRRYGTAGPQWRRPGKRQPFKRSTGSASNAKASITRPSQGPPTLCGGSSTILVSKPNSRSTTCPTRVWAPCSKGARTS